MEESVEASFTKLQIENALSEISKIIGEERYTRPKSLTLCTLSNEKTIVSHSPLKERTAEKVDKSSLADSLRDIAAEISELVNNRAAEQDSKTQLVSPSSLSHRPNRQYSRFGPSRAESEQLHAAKRLRARSKARTREGFEDERSRATLLPAEKARRKDGKPA